MVIIFSPLTISSAILPPSPTHILFSRYSFVYNPELILSSFGAKTVTPPETPLGTIDIF